MLQRHSEDMELAVSENPVHDASEYSDDNAGMILDDDSEKRASVHGDSSECTDDNAAMILDDDSEKPSLPDSPSVYFDEDVKATAENPDVVRVKRKAVVTIDPTPSTRKHVSRVDATTKAPKSILKKKRNIISEVTPAPMRPREEKQQSDWSSSDETDEPVPTGLPFVTPRVPSRLGRRMQAGDMDTPDCFLAKLEQVADSEPVSVSTGNVEDNDEEDDDVFEDPLNEELDMMQWDMAETQNETLDCALLIDTTQDEEHSLSPISRWPSVHDVFYGCYDEEEHVEYTTDDIATLHEFFFGPDGEDISAIPLVTPARATPHKHIRGTPVSAVRVLVLAFLVWQASLVVPNNSNEARRVTLSRRSTNIPSPRATFPFAKAMSDNMMLPHREPATFSKTWLSTVW